MSTEADFTPNPQRAIRIEGQFNEALLERLRPKIIELTAHNREPITVFIDSGGGDIGVLDTILSLLRRTTAENPTASRIITVAAPKAHSAAARLLSAGDFAISYPDSTIFHHGTHYPLSEPMLDGRSGKILAQTLPTLQQRAATSLVRFSVRRFLFIVSASRAQFAEHRAESGDPAATDLECFQAILRGKVSPVAQAILEMACTLSDRYNGLLLHFQKRLKRGRIVTKVRLQRLMQDVSVDFEHRSNKDNLSAWDGGWGAISEHFYFLNDYFRNANDDEFRGLRDWIASPGIPQAVNDGDDEAYFLPFQIFFLALCRTLQEGENYLTPIDALWFGLIDTIRAET